MNLPSSQQLADELNRLNQAMSEPGVVSDAARMKELTREYADKKELFEAIGRLEKIRQEIESVESLINTEDAEMATLAQEDVKNLEEEELKLSSEIEHMLIPRDPRDSKDIILEIRAGAGGEEAALFAAELFRGYSRYAENAGWKVHIVSQSDSEQGGFKEIVAEVSGRNVFGTMKFERGVHRVQRVPSTEKMGRVHTSTVTVAVLPQAEDVDLEIKPEDLRVDTYRASGAGGQHVNKTSSAIRITHLPTNTVIAVQEERSQHKNREKAMKLLRARLLDAREEAQQKEKDQERRSQVGTGDRSEKIRTYNFPQDRITDHRIKKSWSNIPEVMEGNMDVIFEDLSSADKNQRLAAWKSNKQ